MCKVCWILVLIFGLASGGLAYTFLIKGETVAASDGRSAILLVEGERDLVLSEMRAFLDTVQIIITAANKEDMDTVVKAARSVGFAAQQGVPTSLMKKLPISFKQLGMATHKAFDQLAIDAGDLGDKQQVMEQLGELMGNCVTCHATYRIDLDTRK
ncbi:MAG: cytochrome c [Thiotrichaceae bacterium]